jgi:hypothetical protein
MRKKLFKESLFGGPSEAPRSPEGGRTMAPLAEGRRVPEGNVDDLRKRVDRLERLVELLMRERRT